VLFRSLEGGVRGSAGLGRAGRRLARRGGGVRMRDRDVRLRLHDRAVQPLNGCSEEECGMTISADVGTGNGLVLTQDEVRQIVRRSEERALKRDPANKKACIIASKGTLDWAYPPLILASAAAAAGMEAAV